MKKIELTILVVLLALGPIHAQYIPGTSYFGVNNYIEYIAGDMPLIIVAPHAGNLEPNILPDINNRGADNGTMELARFMADSLYLKAGGCRPHMIINHLKPSKLNPVYAAADSVLSAGTHPLALQALNEFHHFIQYAHDQVSTQWGKGHYLELHGNGTDEKWNMIGLGISKTYLNMSDSVIMTRKNYSTIKNLCTAGGADFLEVLKGSHSLGGMLDSLGWKSTTSPAHPAPPDSVTFFYAGQNTWRYGSSDSGTIDATHLESYWEFMVLPANQSKYANDLANSMLHFMNVHYGFTFTCQALQIPASEDETTDLTIFPNPIHSAETLSITNPDAIADIQLVNSMGQLCGKVTHINTLQTNKLPNGVYAVRINMHNGKIKYRKLVVCNER